MYGNAMSFTPAQLERLAKDARARGARRVTVYKLGGELLVELLPGTNPKEPEAPSERVIREDGSVG